MAQFVVIFISNDAIGIEYVFVVEEGVLQFVQDATEVSIQLFADLFFAIVEHLIEAV